MPDMLTVVTVSSRGGDPIAGVIALEPGNSALHETERTEASRPTWRAAPLPTSVVSALDPAHSLRAASDQHGETARGFGVQAWRHGHRAQQSGSSRDRRPRQRHRRHQRLDDLCTPDMINHAFAPGRPPGIEGASRVPALRPSRRSPSPLDRLTCGGRRRSRRAVRHTRAPLVRWLVPQGSTFPAGSTPTTRCSRIGW